MTGYRAPWERPLGGVFAIPVHLDPEVPAGIAVLDVDPEEPRHITGIRVHDRAYELTAEQVEQVRDHYRAMNERAAELLAWWPCAATTRPTSSASPTSDPRNAGGGRTPRSDRHPR